MDQQLASVREAQGDIAGKLARFDESARAAAARVPLPADSPPAPQTASPPAVEPVPTAPAKDNEAEYLDQIGSLTYERDDARGQLAIAQHQLSLLRGQLSQATWDLAQQRQALANESQRVSALTECLNTTQIAVLFALSPVPGPDAGDKVLASTDACPR
jgi:hypothetical protein